MLSELEMKQKLDAEKLHILIAELDALLNFDDLQQNLKTFIDRLWADYFHVKKILKLIPITHHNENLKLLAFAIKWCELLMSCVCMMDSEPEAIDRNLTPTQLALLAALVADRFTRPVRINESNTFALRFPDDIFTDEATRNNEQVMSSLNTILSITFAIELKDCKNPVSLLQFLDIARKRSYLSHTRLSRFSLNHCPLDQLILDPTSHFLSKPGSLLANVLRLSIENPLLSPNIT